MSQSYYKIVAMFNQGDKGWSEVNYYIPPPNTGYSDAANAAAWYMLYRTNLLATPFLTIATPPPYAYGIRVENITNSLLLGRGRGPSTLIPPTGLPVGVNTYPKLGTSGLAPGSPYMALQTSFTSIDGGRKETFMRGLPDAWSGWTDNLAPVNTALLNAMTPFINFMRNGASGAQQRVLGKWALHEQQLQGPLNTVGPPNLPVVNVQLTGGTSGQLQFVTSSPPYVNSQLNPPTNTTLWPIGTRFLVGGIRAGCLTGVGGVYSVAFPGITQTVISNTTVWNIPTCKSICCALPPNACGVGAGYARQLLYGLVTLDSVNPMNIRKRNTGSDFGRTRGAARRKKCSM